MRSIILPVVLAVSAAVAGLSAASCSSSNSNNPPGDDGGGTSSGSSSGSSSSGSSSGSACTPYVSDAGLTSPVVSFQNDVMPLLEHSCGLSTSCHYDPSAIGTLGIFLGCDNTFDAGATSSYHCNFSDPGPLVYYYLVGGPVPDGGLPLSAGDAGGPLVPLETNMPFITAGDPSMSYLMHKIDNDQCTITDCIANNVAVTNQMDTPDMTGLPNWCGQSMPLNGEVLPAGPPCGDSANCKDISTYTRDTVRLWIAQGAKNN
jgi:hypothetical protein